MGSSINSPSDKNEVNTTSDSEYDDSDTETFEEDDSILQNIAAEEVVQSNGESSSIHHTEPDLEELLRAAFHSFPPISSRPITCDLPTRTELMQPPEDGTEEEEEEEEPTGYDAPNIKVMRCYRIFADLYMKQNPDLCRFCVDNGCPVENINHKQSDENGVICPILKMYHDFF